MNKHSSIVFRALLSLLLMLGFYALSLGIVGCFLYFAWMCATGTERVYPRLVVVCICTALIVLYSIIPRREKFVPPGIRLKREEHPRLFAVIEGLAHEIGEKPPDDVFLDHDANACVLQHGTVFGFGGRRAMILGLPLMQLLRVSQMRAVLAHEFGHYHGGDTRLGLIVYQVRAAIGRTIRTLKDAESWVHFPFLWYGTLFMRISQAVSRSQELAADALAADIAGGQVMGSALRRSTLAGTLYPVYIEQELLPVLNGGFRPALAAGFAKFLRSEQVQELAARYLEHEARNPASDPYDTHPSLAARLEALEGLPSRNPPGDDPASVALLEDVPSVELSLCPKMFTDPGIAALPTIRWDQVSETVHRPAIEEFARECAPQLRGQTPRSFPELARHLSELGRRLAPPPIGPDQAASLAIRAIGLSLTSALLREGWKLEADIGCPVEVSRGTERFDPLTPISALLATDPKRTAWLGRCEELGILDLEIVATRAGESGAPVSTEAPEQAAKPPPLGQPPVIGKRTVARRRVLDNPEQRRQMKRRRILIGATCLLAIAIILLLVGSGDEPPVAAPRKTPPIEPTLALFESAWWGPDSESGTEKLRPLLSKRKSERLWRSLLRVLERRGWTESRPVLAGRKITASGTRKKVIYTTPAGDLSTTWSITKGRWLLSGIKFPKSR